MLNLETIYKYIIESNFLINYYPTTHTDSSYSRYVRKYLSTMKEKALSSEPDEEDFKKVINGVKKGAKIDGDIDFERWFESHLVKNNLIIECIKIITYTKLENEPKNENDTDDTKIVPNRSFEIVISLNNENHNMKFEIIDEVKRNFKY